jgi:hypothetical protein
MPHNVFRAPAPRGERQHSAAGRSPGASYLGGVKLRTGLSAANLHIQSRDFV